MEKAREIPPNAAPRDDVDRVRKRLERLGVDFHEAVKKAEISRNTGYRLLRGEGSIGTLRQLEEWVVKQERSRGVKSSDRERAVEEWAELGGDLSKLDLEDFGQMLAALRDYVGAKKQMASAIRKMFRATPEE